MIDGHVHVWRLADRPQPWINAATMPELARDHLLPELEGALIDVGMTGAVLVQVLNDPGETADYLRIAGDSDLLLGVVGWVDLCGSSIGSDLDALRRAGPLVGVRHQAQAEPDPGEWLRRMADGPGLRALAERGLACDLMLRPAQLGEAGRVVADHPEVRFVLDHAGKPPIVTGWQSDESRTWADLVADLGDLANLTCKLSGLATMADLRHWQEADLAPYVEHLLATFGPERLMFGSDWPVSLRAAGYERTVDAARALISGLTPAEQERVLGGTARKAYRLTAPRIA